MQCYFFSSTTGTMLTIDGLAFVVSFFFFFGFLTSLRISFDPMVKPSLLLGDTMRLCAASAAVTLIVIQGTRMVERQRGYAIARRIFSV